MIIDAGGSWRPDTGHLQLRPWIGSHGILLDGPVPPLMPDAAYTFDWSLPEEQVEALVGWPVRGPIYNTITPQDDKALRTFVKLTLSRLRALPGDQPRLATLRVVPPSPFHRANRDQVVAALRGHVGARPYEDGLTLRFEDGHDVRVELRAVDLAADVPSVAMRGGAGWIERDLSANARHHASAGASGAPAQWVAAELSSRNLGGAVLAQATLIDSDFSASNLERANLDRAMAGGACFEHAVLVGASLSKASLCEASFKAARASGSRFVKANLRDARLDEADLSGARFDGAIASGASFHAARLVGASFVTAGLVRADLTNANLAEAHFERTVVDHVRLHGAVGLDTARVVSVVVGGETLAGDAARAWLEQRTRALGVMRRAQGSPSGMMST